MKQKNGQFINVFLLHQVDDILLSIPSISTGMEIFQQLGAHIQLKYNEDPAKLFYATDIIQTDLYIQITAQTYIWGMCLKLGWNPDAQGKFQVPMTPNTFKMVTKEQGPL